RVMKVCGELLVGELAAEPGVPPEEERHQADQPGGEEKEKFLGAGHAGLGFFGFCERLKRNLMSRHELRIWFPQPQRRENALPRSWCVDPNGVLRLRIPFACAKRMFRSG